MKSFAGRSTAGGNEFEVEEIIVERELEIVAKLRRQVPNQVENLVEFFAKCCRGFVLLALGAYRTLGTSHFGGCCRFEPSCSAYAVEAVQKHALLCAFRLIATRLMRCRPGGPIGFDPVPLDGGRP